jgi:VanZ family protein
VRASRLLWLIFTAFIVYGGLIPFHFDGSHELLRQRLHALPLNPFVSPESGQRLSIPDVVQNVLLFLPFGAFGMLAGASFASEAFRSRLRRLLFVSGAGMALSVLVEFLQLFTTDRVGSLADVMTDTVGAVSGGMLAWMGARALTTVTGRLRRAGLVDVPELRPFVVAAIAIVVALWQPFDATLDVSSVVGKLRAVRVDPWQFNGWRDEGTSIMLSVFFATTLASYLSVLGEQRAALKSILLGAIIVFSLEASQLFIASRMPGLWDASVATTGIVIGAAIWSASTRILWPRLWMAVIILATAASAALQMLNPFTWAPAYHSMGWFPFFGYYSHTTFETLSHVIELVLLYLPFGFFVGRSGGSGWRVYGLALAVSLTIAAPIEYLQGWTVGRHRHRNQCLRRAAGGLGWISD